MTTKHVIAAVVTAGLLVAGEALRLTRARRDDPWAAATDQVLLG